MHHVDVNDCTNSFLRKFWEIEADTTTPKLLTEEEKQCELLYEATTIRDEEGRYIVRIPFREAEPACRYGRSREIALKRFCM